MLNSERDELVKVTWRRLDLQPEKLAKNAKTTCINGDFSFASSIRGPRLTFMITYRRWKELTDRLRMYIGSIPEYVSKSSRTAATESTSLVGPGPVRNQP